MRLFFGVRRSFTIGLKLILGDFLKSVIGSRMVQGFQPQPLKLQQSCWDWKLL